jgi:nucleotide-binding universal stress UspA family protein
MVQIPYGDGIGFPLHYTDELEQEGQRRLDAAADVARNAVPDPASLTVTTEVRHGTASLVLRDCSKFASLIVLGTRGRGEFSRAFAGSVTADVTAHAECPVVVLHQDAPKDGPVVVGVDGSAFSEPAIAFAFKEADLRNTSLVAVHAWDPTVDTGAFGVNSSGMSFKEAEQSEQEILSERLAGWLEEYPQVEVRRVVMRDNPAHLLLHYAEEGQLLVVGSRGRGSLAGLLLGSTSQSMENYARCPVAVTRANDPRVSSKVGAH